MTYLSILCGGAVGLALATVVFADPPASGFGLAFVVLLLCSARFWDHAHAMRHQSRRWAAADRLGALLAGESPPGPWVEPILLTLAPPEESA